MPHHKAHSLSHPSRKPWRQAETKSGTQVKAQPENAKPGFENEGEGNVTAARNYDARTEDYIATGNVEPAAQAAKQALESDEGDTLRSAEEIGRRGDPGIDPNLEDTIPDRKNAHRT